MAAPQQFSLRWNNYSQHIVTALDDLRSDDELTDVTLSCDGQRLKAHKILLAACSSFFRDTFKENPCKHPIIIIKGVSFRDLEAVVTFMYNGQVNVSQDRLQTFLAAAELLQIKGLTDVNDKEETSKKRASTQPPVNSSQNHNNSLSHSSRSGTPDLVQRPPSPKRKRAGGDVGNDSVTSVGAFSGVNNLGASLGGTLVGSNGGAHSGLNAEPNDSFQPKVAIKYEDEQEEEDFDDKGNMSSEDNDNSIQDLMCNVEPGTLGSFLSGSGGAGIGTSGTDSSHGEAQHNSPTSALLLSIEGPLSPALPHTRQLYATSTVGPTGDSHFQRQQQIRRRQLLLRHRQTSLGGRNGSGGRSLGNGSSKNLLGKNRSSQFVVPPTKAEERLFYKCKDCNRSFQHIQTLQAHSAQHAGKTKCQYCNRVFSNVGNRNAHVKMHHPDAKALSTNKPPPPPATN